MENFLNKTVSNMFKNELARTDLQPTEMHVIIGDVKRFSTMANHVITIGTQNPEVYNIDGTSAIIFSTDQGTRLTSTIGEQGFKYLGNANEIIAQTLELKLAEMIDARMLTMLKGKATAVTVTGDSPTLEDRVLAIKSKYGATNFKLLVGLEDYLYIKKNYNGEFPYEVLYHPGITDKTMYSFRTQETYLNVLADKVEYSKDILTGQYRFALNIRVLQSGTSRCYKA